MDPYSKFRLELWLERQLTRQMGPKARIAFGLFLVAMTILSAVVAQPLDWHLAERLVIYVMFLIPAAINIVSGVYILKNGGKREKHDLASG